nr:MAG TPA: helix-turn-helix domain protein [Caudoviricetes sp.]
MTVEASKRYVLNKKAIKHYLIDHDLIQSELAEMLGISTSYFNELLNGRKSITLKTLFAIADETHIDPRELVEEVDE